MNARLPFALTALVLACGALAHGQGFIIDNNDGGSEGFNDPTARTSDIDGQPATLGQDRLDCFAAAAQVWADYLDISVNIVVSAQFNNLGGSANSATLGFAGPQNAARNFSGAPLNNMYFVSAQANQHAGANLDGGFPEIEATFNSDVDGNVVLGNTTWYYGTDGDPPPGKLDFFSTALHELGHGLGFLTLMDLGSGALNGGTMDIYTNQLRRAGTTNLNYSQMNNAQRAAANTSGEVVWKGALVVAAQGGNHPMYAPAPLQGGSSISHWDTSSFPNLLMEPSATVPFIALTLEAEAFEDMLWPINDTPIDPLDPDNVYVDFDFTGTESGGDLNPFNTLGEGLVAANPDATIHIFAGTSSETFVDVGAIDQAVTLELTGSGTVIIGSGARSSGTLQKATRGFVSRR